MFRNDVADQLALNLVFVVLMSVGFKSKIVQSEDNLPRQFAFRTAMPYILCHEEPQTDTGKTFEFRGLSLAQCSHATLSCTVP